MRVGSGRLEGRAVLQGVGLPSDDYLEETGRPLRSYPIARPASDRAVVYVALRRVIHPGTVPVVGGETGRLDLRDFRRGHAHQLARVVEAPEEGARRWLRLDAADQRDRLVLQRADHLGGRAVLADRRVWK